MSYTSEFEDLKKKDHSGSDAEVLAFYDKLPTVKVEELLNQRWKGGVVNTGHWIAKELEKIRWFGKWYRGAWDAIPLVSYNSEGKLFSDQTLKGNATLWMVEFRGKVSAAMVYNGVPTFDHFRKVDDKTYLGAMNGPAVPGWPDTVKDGRYCFFYLERIDKFPVEFVESEKK